MKNPFRVSKPISTDLSQNCGSDWLVGRVAVGRVAVGRVAVETLEQIPNNQS